MKQTLKTMDRRSFLKGTAVAAGASAISFTTLFGFSRAFAQDATGTDDDLQTVINLASTAELFASTHYLAAINAAEAGDLDLDQAVIDYLKTGFLAEWDHYQLLLSLGATPVVTEFYVPENLFSDVATFSQITEVAETTFVNAYLAATRIFVNLGQPAFAVTASQIAAVEAEHKALSRQIGMRLANSVSYEKYEFGNVSEAVPILQPFLDGSGEGFVGPVQPPSDDDAAVIRAQADALGYVNSVPFAAMETAPAEPMATEDAAMGTGTTAMVTARNQAVNIRSTPDTSAQIVGSLAAGASIEINGQRMGSDGNVWWSVTSGGWIRSDTVDESDGADALPQM